MPSKQVDKPRTQGERKPGVSRNFRIGDRVRHKVYGLGTIVAESDYLETALDWVFMPDTQTQLVVESSLEHVDE